MTTLLDMPTIMLPEFTVGKRTVRMDYYVAFGAALRECRTQRHKSQETLAHDAGLHRTYISMLEKGQCSPKLVTVFALSEALGMPAAALVDRTESIMKASGDDDTPSSSSSA